jgi:zinc transporter
VKLNGRGAGTPLAWGQLDAPLAEGEFVWIHLNRTDSQAQHWLRHDAGLDPIVVDALLAEETRPRCTEHEGGLLLNLRGVNLNPEADPEDMLSIRIWVTAKRVISARRHPLLAIRDVCGAIDQGAGPATPGMLVAQLSELLMVRMGDAISDLEDDLDGLEEHVIEEEQSQLRSELAVLRRRAITFRRHIAPQRDALARMWTLDTPLLQKRERNRVREVYDSVSRQVENLDEVREHAAVIQEELTTRLTGMMNQKLYVLSAAAALFLPLNLLAGMLGMNVAGIPGATNPWAFAVVILLLIAVGLLEYAFMRWKKWI